MTTRRSILTALAGGALAIRAAAGEARPWPSQPPAGCPFEPSRRFKGLLFTGRRARYTDADTWYPSWASDGNLYSPWTDGTVNGLSCMSFGEKAATGHATILGDSPMDLKIVRAATHPGAPSPYGGRYPCGSLVYNGVWYYGTYCLMDTKQGLNWDVLGPFVGFRHSNDLGRTWSETPHTPIAPLFGEPKEPGGPVKIGAPHFVDFGNNLRHSPDGKAYIVGHGAVASDNEPRQANLSWITGDQIYLARVEPGIGNMNDRSRYEFFAGRDRNERPLWTRDFQKIRPLFEWNNRVGCVTVTHNAPLKTYFMCVTDGGTTISRFNTYILESAELTGPWRMVVFMQHFGEQGYFVNIPSKFIAEDGRTAWLLYSANFTNGYLKTNYREDPPGSGYGMCLQEVRLLS